MRFRMNLQSYCLAPTPERPAMNIELLTTNGPNRFVVQTSVFGEPEEGGVVETLHAGCSRHDMALDYFEALIEQHVAEPNPLMRVIHNVPQPAL